MDPNKQVTKTIAEKVLNFIMLIFAIIVVSGMFYYGCSNPTIIDNSKLNHDSIYHDESKQDSVIESSIHKDSILVVTKIKYIHHYVTVYDSLYINDTLCQQSLITLYNAFGDLNNTNDSMLANKDTIIKAFNNKLTDKQSHITIDSTYITTVPELIKSEFKRGSECWG